MSEESKIIEEAQALPEVRWRVRWRAQPALQQRWIVWEGGKQRREWRDVPTVREGS